MAADEKPEVNECPRRGRPRVRRTIATTSASRCYKPCCQAGIGEGISLQPEEIELIRLIDLEGLEQEEAAERLGVSRKTAWRDLHEARRKIADAHVNGKGIEMAGCTKAAEVCCPKCPRDSADQQYEQLLFLSGSDARYAGARMETGRCTPAPAPHTIL